MNNEIVLHEETKNDIEESQITFQMFVKEKRKNLSIRLYGAKHSKKTEAEEQPKRMLKTRELANMVGIKESMFPKILNMQKPTKERDCIIAICLELQLDSEETDEALRLYNGMRYLDTEIPREDELITILEDNSIADSPISIEAVNEHLEKCGYAPLSIINSRPSQKNVKTDKDCKYYKTMSKTKTVTDELIYGDRFNSLVTNYSPYRYKSYAEMTLVEKQGNRRYHLSCDPDGHCSMRDPKCNIQCFESPADSGEFEVYFTQLKADAKRELKNMLHILDNTKNYRSRISAGMKNDGFHVYAETFNYLIPELNEYYFMNMVGNNYCLSIFNESVFMSNYLSEQEYKKWYVKSKDLVPVAKYRSVEELDSAIKEVRLPNRIILQYRKKMFIQLKDDVDKLLDDICDKKVFVKNLNNFYDCPDMVCEFFKVKEEFDCSYVDEYEDIMVAGIDNHIFDLPDGNRVTITLQDLYDAFELGFCSIQEVCLIKHKYGSVRKVLD